MMIVRLKAYTFLSLQSKFSFGKNIGIGEHGPWQTEQPVRAPSVNLVDGTAHEWFKGGNNKSRTVGLDLFSWKTTKHPVKVEDVVFCLKMACHEFDMAWFPLRFHCLMNLIYPWQKYKDGPYAKRQSMAFTGTFMEDEGWTTRPSSFKLSIHLESLCFGTSYGPKTG